MGDSTGGYTAVMLGVTSGRTTDRRSRARQPRRLNTVQAVIDWFGPTDDFGLSGKVGATESPYTYIASGQALPPFWIAHGDADAASRSSSPATSKKR